MLVESWQQVGEIRAEYDWWADTLQEQFDLLITGAVEKTGDPNTEGQSAETRNHRQMVELELALDGYLAALNSENDLSPLAAAVGGSCRETHLIFQVDAAIVGMPLELLRFASDDRTLCECFKGISYCGSLAKR